MKKLFSIFIASIILGCSQSGKPSFDINLPIGYEVEESNDNYNLLTASKYTNGEIVGMIEIRYSDDWSFSTFTNKEYITHQMTNDKIEATASMIFDNFNIHSKEELYLKGVGDCLSSIYSGDDKTNGVRITNLVAQFVKDDKLFTLIGSSFPSNFSSEHKDFLKSFDTFKL
jgi:hypothetical protein